MQEKHHLSKNDCYFWHVAEFSVDCKQVLMILV